MPKILFPERTGYHTPPRFLHTVYQVIWIVDACITRRVIAGSDVRCAPLASEFNSSGMLASPYLECTVDIEENTDAFEHPEDTFIELA